MGVTQQPGCGLVSSILVPLKISKNELSQSLMQAETWQEEAASHSSMLGSSSRSPASLAEKLQEASTTCQVGARKTHTSLHIPTLLIISNANTDPVASLCPTTDPSISPKNYTMDFSRI